MSVQLFGHLLQMLLIVQAFIACRVDWCNSLLYGVPENLLRKVQSVQNAADRLLTSTGRHDHITPVLRLLHWLPVQRRVEFKIACLVHRPLASKAPTYLTADIRLVFARHPTEHSLFHGHSSFGDRSFAAAEPRLWNSLQTNLRQMTRYGRFRKHLNTFIWDF